MSRILVVDDERDICRALEFVLSGDGYSVTTAQSGEDAVALLRKSDFDVVLTDLRMEKMDGIAVLEEAKRLNPETPVIFMTAYASVESAVEAMKKGAADYIVKPFMNEEIRLTIRRTLDQARLKTENLALKRELSQRRSGCRDVVFASQAMQKLFDLLENVIPTRSNVLLLGESGTGKGLIAELVHCGSPRRDMPFISINCSAIPETLLESELFGYRRGAFTGAVSDKKGLISLADGGTLFLDEIGDMPQALQSKLLKVLESGEVIPLGDTKPTYSDIRLISATNQDIEKKLKDGSFREDLYYRLSVIEVTIPPLRQRRDDIPLLADHFIRKFSAQYNRNMKGLTKDGMEVFKRYLWPGNVRELSNVLERAVVLCEGDSIDAKSLPPKMLLQRREDVPFTLKDIISEYERNVILSAYESNNRNKEATASALDIDLATLYRKMKKLGID